MLYLNSQIYEAAINGLKSDHTLNFSVDSQIYLPLESSWQGDRIHAKSIFIDNSKNSTKVEYVSSNERGVIPPYVSGHLSCGGLSEIVFSCDSPQQVDITVLSSDHPNGFISSGVGPENTQANFICGENITAKDVVSIGADGKLYWCNSSTAAIGLARPINNVAVDYNVELGSDKYDLSPVQPFILTKDSTIKSITIGDFVFSCYICNDGVGDCIAIVKYNEVFEIIDQVILRYPGTSTILYTSTFSCRVFDNKFLITTPYLTEVICWLIDTNLNSQFFVVEIGLTIYSSKGLIIDYGTSQILFLYFSCTGFLAYTAVDMSANFIIGISGITMTTPLYQSQYNICENSDKQIAAIFPTYNGVTSDVYVRLIDPLTGIGSAATLLSGHAIAGIPPYNMDIAPVDGTNLMVVCSVSNTAEWRLYTKDFVSIAGAQYGTTGNLMRMNHGADTSGILVAYQNQTFIYVINNTTGIILGSKNLENSYATYGSCINILSDENDNFFVIYKNNVGSTITCCLINSIGTARIGVEFPLLVSNPNENTCLLQLKNSSRRIGYPCILINAIATLWDGIFYCTEIPIVTPIGVATSAGVLDEKIKVRVLGEENTRLIFSPPYSVDARGQTPPGQKMSIIGDVAKMEGIL